MIKVNSYFSLARSESAFPIQNTLNSISVLCQFYEKLPVPILDSQGYVHIEVKKDNLNQLPKVANNKIDWLTTLVGG